MGRALSVSVDPADLDYCYLTTLGRTSGRPHEIEIWFALHDGAIYMLSGGGRASDWVKNLIANPHITVRLGDDTKATTARIVSDPGEDALARRLVVEKYKPRHADELEVWGRTSLPIAVDWAAGVAPDGG